MADIDDFRHLELGTVARYLHLACSDKLPVLAGDADGPASIAVDGGDDFLVDAAAQHHFNDIHGLGIGDAHAVDEFGLNI